MKKDIRITAFFLAAALTASCARELDRPYDVVDRPAEINRQDDEMPISFGSVNTKANLSGASILWVPGDQIAVYEYLGRDLLRSDLCLTESSEEAGDFIPGNYKYNTSWVSASGPDNENYYFFSYYPESILKSPSDGIVTLSNVYPVQVGTSETVGPYLICWGKDESKVRADIASGGSYPSFAFSPRVAILNINVSNPTDIPLTVASFKVKADVGYLSGDVELDLATGVISTLDPETPAPSGELEGFSTISLDPGITIPAGGVGTIYAVVLPNSEISSLDFEMTAMNEETLYLVDIPSVQCKRFASGMVYDIPAEISSISRKVNGVAITSDEATIWAGNTATYAATVEYETGDPSAEVVWSSSDENVATVNPATGVITGVAPGTAMIVATSSTDSRISDSLSVHVNTVTGIHLASSYLGIAKNHTSYIAGSVVFNSGGGVYGDIPETIYLHWTSSAPGVAALSDDIKASDYTVSVTGFNVGQSVLTVSIPANTYGQHPLVSATCNVNVNYTVTEMDFNGSDVTLWKGQQTTYSATVSYETEAPNSDVTWTSSAPGVATVDGSGHVTAVGYGSATITASSNANPEISASRIVNVNAVTGLTVSSSSMSVNHYASGALRANIQLNDGGATYGTVPAMTVNWSSNNAGIASVSASSSASGANINVTGASCSTATITASVPANTYGTHSAQSKTCSVTVNRVLSSVSIGTAVATVWTGQQVTYTATTYYSNGATANAASLYSWSSSNTNVALVNENGVVYGREAGTAVIYAYSKENGAKVGSQTIKVRKMKGLELDGHYCGNYDYFEAGERSIADFNNGRYYSCRLYYIDENNNDCIDPYPSATWQIEGFPFYLNTTAGYGVYVFCSDPFYGHSYFILRASIMLGNQSSQGVMYCPVSGIY
ncbi:MAG: Ig-like domain-containing protein [Bacteroidales bacterium]|nr:Ig-like domain-containing protein [Bacteroidales bacterium]